MLDLLRARHTTMWAEAPPDLSRCENTVRAILDRRFSLNGAGDDAPPPRAFQRTSISLAEPSPVSTAQPRPICQSRVIAVSVAPWNGDLAQLHSTSGVSRCPMSAPSISRSTSPSRRHHRVRRTRAVLLLSAASPPRSPFGEGCGAGQKGANPALSLRFYRPRRRRSSTSRLAPRPQA